MSTDNSIPPRAAFVTTRWTQVLQARGDSEQARAALSDLCAAYYTPVLSFIRNYTREDTEAVRDLTQEFFAQFLSRGALETVDPELGRFRSFLLGAVKHFVAHQRERASAAKRGGGEKPLSLDAQNPNETSAQLQVADPSASLTDETFDRQWALTLVERALNALQQEFKSDNRLEHFEILKPWLLGEVESLSQADAARRLQLSEGAVKVAIHRLRKKFRELVRAEIAGTVESTEQVQEELAYLLKVLSAQ